MRQRLNKVRAFKQQERPAVLEIAKACGLWFYAQTNTNKMPILAGFTVQHFINHHNKEKVLKPPTKISILTIT